ncbi:putative pre-16S rRNA nuclease, ribonuclease H-like domain-containing protein [Lupinus albus]|uniref:Putative pre-16S rRNA nuclease, ribonuclease H-like domain-containing protein n=1 Tax=Lupinus albus TaxID=3870 RepID=A0A6A4PYB7_LUPAL|nr:putative pre-16S rRNA nuclease, ribonuclease H-like domain-containing protein [Lupinus albus]
MKQVTALQLFHAVAKKSHARLLGLDVGDKYVGLSLSDFHNQVASPLSVLLRKKSNIDLMASDFECLISQYSLKGFVIGIPFDRHRVSADAVQVKAFINDLSNTKRLHGLPYTYWNERFTSKNVELFLKPLNLYHPYHSKTMLDKFAAVGILQGYLDYANKKEVKLEME